MHIIFLNLNRDSKVTIYKFKIVTLNHSLSSKIEYAENCVIINTSLYYVPQAKENKLVGSNS